MGRAPCCDKANVKRGPWSPEEDAKLKSYIQDHGTGGNWIALPQKIGLKRCGKSCRLRWLNYLRPNIKHGGFSDEEDNIICTLYMTIGSRWSIIAAQLPGRTDNDIKNYWNTRLKKKLLGKQRKQVLQQARCYTYVKQENIKTENFMAPELTNLHPAAYCLPEPPHVAAATMSNPNPNQEPLPHLQQNSSITASNFHHPYHLSSIPQDHQLYHNINPMSLPPYNLTFTNNFQLPNTHYSNDFQGYVNNYPVGLDDTIYGLESALSGVLDRVIGGSVNGTSTSAESTTSWGGDISSFVCSPMVSNIYEDEHRQGIWGFEEPIGTSGFNNQCTI